MSEKNNIILAGGLVAGGLLLSKFMEEGVSDDVKDLVSKINEHVSNANFYSGSLREQMDEFDEKITRLRKQETVSEIEWDDVEFETQQMGETLALLQIELDEIKKAGKELAEKLDDSSIEEKIRMAIIAFSNDIIQKYAGYAALGVIVIIIYKGRNVLRELFKKRKGGGGNPETPVPVVPYPPYETVNPTTKTPNIVPDDYNPIADPNPIPEKLPEYKNFPTDTPVEDLPDITPHEQETLERWEEIWTVIELLSDESKQLLYERLPSPMNEAIYSSWEELPLSFGVLFGSPLISAASWHEVSRKGEFGKFAIACGVILSAAVVVAALIAVGLIATTAGVPAAIAAAIIALGAGVGAVAA